MKFFSFFGSSICSVLVACSSSSSFTSWPTTHTIVRAKVAATMMTVANLPNCRMGTRPKNIIRKTTTKSMAAVDRFSNPMSRQAGSAIQSIHLKAFLSAPFSSRCIAARIWATANTTVPLAISDGWKVIPNRLIHRPASPTLVPASNTHSRVSSDISIRNGVMSLK